MRSTCGTIVKATAGAPNQSCMTQDAQKAMVNGQHRQVPIKKEAPPPVPCLCLGGTSISSEYIFYIEGTLYMVCYIFIFGVIYLSVRRWPSWKQYIYIVMYPSSQLLCLIQFIKARRNQDQHQQNVPCQQVANAHALRIVTYIQFLKKLYKYIYIQHLL